MIDHYSLGDEELARRYWRARLYVLLGHGGSPAKTFLTYLEGVRESREEGQIPPFQAGDWVSWKRHRAGSKTKALRIQRIYYFGDGLWRLALYGDPITHLARHFEKIVVTGVREDVLAYA